MRAQRVPFDAQIDVKLLALSASSRKIVSFNKFCYPYFHERAIVMSRLVYSVMFAFGLAVLSLSTVGCGGGSSENTVIEETRSEAEIAAEDAEYEAMMNAQDEVTE